MMYSCRLRQAAATPMPVLKVITVTSTGHVSRGITWVSDAPVTSRAYCSSSKWSLWLGTGDLTATSDEQTHQWPCADVNGGNLPLVRHTK